MFVSEKDRKNGIGVFLRTKSCPLGGIKEIFMTMRNFSWDLKDGRISASGKWRDHSWYRDSNEPKHGVSRKPLQY